MSASASAAFSARFSRSTTWRGVARGAHHRLGAEPAAVARATPDDDRLAERLGELRRELARDQVVAAAGGEGHHDAHGAVRPPLGGHPSGSHGPGAGAAGFRPHRPVQFGARFSMNAARPSFASSVSASVMICVSRYEIACSKLMS